MNYSMTALICWTQPLLMTSSIDTVDTTLEINTTDMEEGREDEIQEERNDPERDYEGEIGRANRSSSPNKRKRWWKYTGFCPESLQENTYAEHVSWIQANIFERIREMSG